jgi:hypothetical protein
MITRRRFSLDQPNQVPFCKQVKCEQPQDLLLGYCYLMTEFDECQQQIDAHGNPDLSHHGIFAGAKKRFDLEVLLDPFKKQLHLPALLINGSNGLRGQLEMVGDKDIFPLCLRILA